MKYIHWIAYPALIAVIIWLGYGVLDQAVWLDDMKSGSKFSQEINEDLLRFVSIRSPCDKSPKQLMAAMGVKENDYVATDTEVAHGGFRASYKNGRLVSIAADDMGRSAAVCDNDGAKH